MAGKITRQVKNKRPILVNGKWVHPLFDIRPLTKTEMERLADRAKQLGLTSA